MVSAERVRQINSISFSQKGPVVYWMSRDQRVHDNWALLYAIEQAQLQQTSLHVVFVFSPAYPGANMRHFHFLIEGLKEVETNLSQHQIPFHVLMGYPGDVIPRFLKNSEASVLVSDFDPLRWKREWKKVVNDQIAIPHFEVDTHNIVPCWVASSKLEFGAYTIRPKINRLLQRFLVPFPNFSGYLQQVPLPKTNWHAVEDWLKPDRTVEPVDWLKPGERSAALKLNEFIGLGLHHYEANRNNPLLKGQSDLSPYLHFGHISAQRVALEVLSSSAGKGNQSAFLEELIIRKELSENFSLYSPKYDSPECFQPWALRSHAAHRNDEREHIYSLSQFEKALTHDPLWNAAQKEMVITGKMHGYMRMYWAKKILEWTPSPEVAMQTAIYLNDKYSLDGRDPNGYAGIAWSIGGVHDRAWADRPVFGKIRYMNYSGCRRKFNVDGYIDKIKDLG